MKQNIFKFLIESETFRILTDFELPNWKKESHVEALARTMRHYNISEDIIVEGIQNLREAQDTGISAAASKLQKSKGLVHLGKGYYSSTGKAPATHKRDGNQFVKVAAGDTGPDSKPKTEKPKTKATSATKATPTSEVPEEPQEPIVDNRPLSPERAEDMASKGSVAAKLKVLDNAGKPNVMDINTKIPEGYHTLSDNFNASSEISTGLLSDQYRTIEHNGKSVEFRQMVDYEGNPLDFSDAEHRTVGLKILNDRLEASANKIKEASTLLADPKKMKQSKHTSTSIRKWLGELGEIKLLHDLLDSGTEAYLLTASAVKNDIIAISNSKDDRQIDVSLISVKTTDLDTVPNKMGSNVMPDMKKWIESGETDTVTIGESKFDALSTARTTMEVKRQIYKALSELDGVHRNGTFVGDASNYKAGYEEKTHDAPEGFQRKVFKNDTDWRRNRLVDEASVNSIFSTPKIEKNILKNIASEGKVDEDGAKKILTTIKDDLLNRIQQSDGNFTVSDVDTFMYEMFGNIIEETDAKVIPSADTGILSISKTGEMTTSILTAEDSSKSRFDDINSAKKLKDKKARYIAIGKATGLDMRSRRLGGPKKDKGTGHLFPIDNPVPPKDAKTKGMPIKEYVNKFLK